MRYIVLGANGQLGRDLCPRLEGEVHPLTRKEIDLTNPEMIASLGDYSPDVVINCAAYNFVDKAEDEPDKAFAVNALGIRQLTLACEKLNCALVHFSTDYVFGLEENRRTPYLETDNPGPVSVYGLSKLAGEYLVRSHCSRHFLIRTCGLYGVWGSGGKGRNFVETMLRLAGEGKSLKVVADQICTPSYTVDIAVATAQLIQGKNYGIYHLTNSGSCSWFELASAVFEEAGVQADLSPTTSAEYGAPARRPGYSVLGTMHRFPDSVRPRPWRQALTAYLQERSLKKT